MKTKNLWMMAAVAMMAVGCTQEADETVSTPQQQQEKMMVTFAIEGDFELPRFGSMTRALTADGKAMTDLWVLDYVDGELVQQVHQTSEDETFGSPAMALDYGTHHVYFVCSRGKTPTLSTAAHGISWTSPSDTFWADESITVASGSAASRSVTLDRVATKLSVTICDELPEGLATIDVTPGMWYYAIDYLTGLPTGAQTDEPRTITIPASYAGRTNTSLSVYGLSAAAEWTSDVTITARDGEDDILGQATITDAPFKANRVTAYSGNLFASTSGFSVMFSDTWDDEYTGTW